MSDKEWKNYTTTEIKYLYGLIKYYNSLEKKNNLYDNWVRKYNYSFLINRLRKIDNNGVYKVFFEPLFSKTEIKESVSKDRLNINLPRLIDLKKISSSCEKNITADICCSYIDLKDMRNNINHAGAENITSGTLQDRILTELDKIQKAINKQ